MSQSSSTATNSEITKPTITTPEIRMLRSQISGLVLVGKEVIPLEVVSERLLWLAQIVRSEARHRVVEVWMAQGVNEINESKASHAWVAFDEVYGRDSWPPEGIHASDRVRRIANEVAGRALRSAYRQISLIEAVLPTILPQAVFETLDSSLRTPLPWPSDTTGTERRDVIRMIRRFERENGCLPESANQVVSCPSFGDYFLCPLDAADNQQVKLDGLELGLLLPTREKPRKQDWAWHKLTLTLPKFGQERYGPGKIHRPSLRITPTKNYFLVPIEAAVPALIKSDKIFAVDWGCRRLSTGAIISLDPQNPTGRAISTGRPYFFNSRQLQSKLNRQRAQTEILGVKITQQDKLLAGLYNQELFERRTTLATEKRCVETSSNNAREQLAYAHAQWAVNIALAEGAGTIAEEDLADLQSTDRGHLQNGKINIQPRGLTQEKLNDLAKLNGLRLIKGNPRGTSSFCSRCGRPSVFWHAPDRKSGDSNWLVCLCGRSDDRDYAGAESIGAVALDPPQANPKRSRKHNPTPGPASRRQIRVQRDKHRIAQATPYSYHTHMFDTNTDNNPPKPQRRTNKHTKTQHLPLRSGVYRQTTPRRVGRGSVVAQKVEQAERLSLDPTAHREARVVNPTLALDGLSSGYWHAVKFSRPRVLALTA